VALYATGAGQTTPPGISGSVSTQTRLADYPVPQLAVKVTVGGEPAEIIYAGAAPHTVSGLLQVNFRVPANATLGDAVPIVLTVGDSHSPDGVTMAVRSAVQRVLVIDPDSSVRNWFRKVLTQAGYDVLAAQSGPEALAEASGHPVDLVISSLTILDGERVTTALRAERPQLKIIATAGGLDAATLRSADLLGAQAIFAKPVTSSLVLRRVRELLRSHPVPYVAGADPPLVPLNRTIAR
jgi:CheY-like chemotaxis protein